MNQRKRAILTGEILTYSGTALIGVGCWMCWPPLAFISVGAILVAAATVGSFR